MLEVAIAGPPDGLPLFVHHGTPGAAEMFGPLVEIGAERGMRHITYSRPGYGGSGRHPGRTVADCVPDVVASPMRSVMSASIRSAARAADRTRSRARRSCPTA